MAFIKVMDEILANKIAAGEVVERCASVVKELVENSIDANSSEIKIEIIESGTKEIKVTDNGNGMDKDDAVLAFCRHATSKLISEDDLFHINTLGFRGEALASIASVSKVTLKTSTGEVGTIVNINGGKIINVENGDARRGTIIVINDLFFNTPARLKHMKSLYAELASITEYINKLALSHPDIKFTLVNNNNTLLSTDGSGNLLKTIKSIYGIDMVKKMLPVTGSNDDYDINGYITIPEIHRSSRSHMITLVNGRVVRNMDINRTINDSYHSYKPDNRYPVVVLDIQVDPSLVDVNIHPTKMDIKFSKIEELMTLIENIIKSTLKGTMLIPHVEVKMENTEPLFSTEYRSLYKEQTLNLDRISEEATPYEMVINEELVEDSSVELNVSLTCDENPIESIENNERLPELYPVGLVHGTYIICQNEIGMYLIDQHAAKERVNYELFKKRLGNPSTESIALLFPFTIELSNTEYIILKENFNILTNIGFEVDEFGINSIIIKSHPTWLPRGYEEEATRRIIDIVIQQERSFSVEKFNESIATMLSCKLAIKANENITLLEMENLINDLRRCDNPFNCPHGRPTVIYYSNYDLEKLFKRSGF